MAGWWGIRFSNTETDFGYITHKGSTLGTMSSHISSPTKEHGYAQLFETLGTVRDLSETDKSIITAHSTYKTLAAKEYFSTQGTVPTTIGFVVSGIFRVYTIDDFGLEKTKYFLEEEQFMVDYESYTQGIASPENIEAVLPAYLIVFTKKNLEDLAVLIPAWQEVQAVLTQKMLMLKVKRLSPLISESAESRYLRFLKDYPKLALRVPLSHLASYLGMTPSSLSRIRKQLS